MVDQNFNKALSLFKEGKLDEAKQLCIEIINIEKEKKTLNLLAAIEFMSGNAQLSIEILEDTIKEFEDEQSYFNLGKIKKDLFKNDEAKKLFKKTIKINKNFISAYIGIAEINILENKFDTALDFLDEAKKIDKNFKNLNYFYGEIFFNKREFSRAENFYEKELKLYPKSDLSLFGLARIKEGSFLREEAISLYEKSLDIKKTLWALINLAILYQDIDKLDEAEELLIQAIEINSKFYKTYSNLSSLYEKKGELDEACRCAHEAIHSYGLSPNKNQNDIELLNTNLFNIIEKITLSKNFYSTELTKESKIFTDEKQINKNILINKNFVYLEKLCNEKVINFRQIKATIQNYSKNLFDKIISQKLDEIEIISNDIITKSFLRELFIDNIDCENFLIECRKKVSMLYENSSEIFNKAMVRDLAYSLAMQCYHNEYIWEISKDERKLIQTIENKLKKTNLLEFNNFESELLILLMYKPLNEIINTNKDENFEINFNYNELNDLKKIQIKNKFLEKELLSEIKTFGKISNKVSKNVREQYEQNPYPRWNKVNLKKEDFYNKQINKEIYPKTIQDCLDKEGTEILIAGCGSGQHPIQVSLKAQKSKIYAVDISKSNLKYALKKSREHKVENIDWYHGDILELEKLNKKFDCIESSGVLHHMEYPQKAFDILGSLLKPNGIIRIGLYSKLWKDNFKKFRKYRLENKIGKSIDDIRDFRNFIKNDSSSERNIIIDHVRDFYCASEFADFLMHDHEQFFTIPEIKKMIKDNYEFLGFTFPQDNNETKNKYKIKFSEDKSLTNLENWHKFELENPFLFKSMYNFTLKKISD